MKSFYKEFTILDTVYNLAAAWQHVEPPTTLQKSWGRILLNVIEQISPEPCNNCQRSSGWGRHQLSKC